MPNVLPEDAAACVVVHKAENFLNGPNPPIFHFPGSIMISLSQALGPLPTPSGHLCRKATGHTSGRSRRLLVCSSSKFFFKCSTNVGTVQISQHCAATGGEERSELLDFVHDLNICDYTVAVVQRLEC